MGVKLIQSVSQSEMKDFFSFSFLALIQLWLQIDKLNLFFLFISFSFSNAITRQSRPPPRNHRVLCSLRRWRWRWPLSLHLLIHRMTWWFSFFLSSRRVNRQISRWTVDRIHFTSMEHHFRFMHYSSPSLIPRDVHLTANVIIFWVILSKLVGSICSFLWASGQFTLLLGPPFLSQLVLPSFDPSPSSPEAVISLPFISGCISFALFLSFFLSCYSAFLDWELHHGFISGFDFNPEVSLPTTDLMSLHQRKNKTRWADSHHNPRIRLASLL